MSVSLAGILASHNRRHLQSRQRAEIALFMVVVGQVGLLQPTSGFNGWRSTLGATLWLSERCASTKLRRLNGRPLLKLCRPCCDSSCFIQAAWPRQALTWRWQWRAVQLDGAGKPYQSSQECTSAGTVWDELNPERAATTWQLTAN